MDTSLSLIDRYPKEKYTLLVPIEKTANISEIQSPVISAVKISSDLEDNEIYVQTKGKAAYTKNNTRHPAEPARYALTKKGLNKLAAAAGIEKLEPEQLVPSTCQKCAMVNRNSGKMAPCGTCQNKDVRYRVTISVPQISGPAILISDENEINVELKTKGMSEERKVEFMRTLAGRCITGAYNRAIRAALQLKSTYLLEEFEKPFVVAYLAPNLDNPDVKQAAIENMFSSHNRLYGKDLTAGAVLSTAKIQAQASQEEETEDIIDMEEQGDISEEPGGGFTEEDRYLDYYCDKCGERISEKVWKYSIDKYGIPLCYKCQRGALPL